MKGNRPKELMTFLQNGFVIFGLNVKQVILRCKPFFYLAGLRLVTINLFDDQADDYFIWEIIRFVDWPNELGGAVIF